MSLTQDMVDQYIARTTPAITMPRAGSLPRLDCAGHRYLVTAQGLHLEVRRDWIHAILPLASSSVALPFGAGPDRPKIDLLCGAIPRALLEAFRHLATARLPVEVAAWVVWNDDSGEFALMPLRAVDASPTEVQYERPVLERGWHLVLDLHSHPTFPAAFSAQDDRDDGAAGEVKLCGVLGNVDTAPRWAFRLAACGVFHHLDGASQ